MTQEIPTGRKGISYRTPSGPAGRSPHPAPLGRRRWPGSRPAAPAGPSRTRHARPARPASGARPCSPGSRAPGRTTARPRPAPRSPTVPPASAGSGTGAPARAAATPAPSGGGPPWPEAAAAPPAGPGRSGVCGGLILITARSGDAQGNPADTGGQAKAAASAGSGRSVGVPVGARAGGEPDVADDQPRRLVGCLDLVDVDAAGGVLRRSFGGGLTGSSSVTGPLGEMCRRALARRHANEGVLVSTRTVRGCCKALRAWRPLRRSVSARARRWLRAGDAVWSRRQSGRRRPGCAAPTRVRPGPW